MGYVKQAYVMKVAAGIPGDRLQIKDQTITINGEIVAIGMPLVDTSKVPLKSFERDEVIPAGHVFMMGTHPMSNDSRYWGYLSLNDVVGRGYKIL
ncbi:MAG: signal peptidase I [Burkholderiales bacterium PBB4]|nr:MAG: signal peptidase I [Burkholderiales bacterium PBB4]